MVMWNSTTEPDEVKARITPCAISGSRAEQSFPSVICPRPVMAPLRASGALGGML